MTNPIVKYFKNSENLGLVGNYNKALKDYATGEYIMFVPDDDILLNKDYISRAMDYIIKYKLSWIAAGSYSINVKNRTYKEFRNKEFKLFNKCDFFNFHRWGFDNFAGLTILFNRKEALLYGSFTENLYNYDLELIFKMAINGNVAIMNTIEALYAITDNQSNHLVDPEYMFNGFKLYENLKEVSTDKYLNDLLDNNIKSYISACFRYFMDRDAFGEMIFDDLYWLNHFNEINNGIYADFLDDDAKDRYQLFKNDKKAFVSFREKSIKNTSEKVIGSEMLSFIKEFDDN